MLSPVNRNSLLTGLKVANRWSRRQRRRLRRPLTYALCATPLIVIALVILLSYRPQQLHQPIADGVTALNQNKLAAGSGQSAGSNLTSRSDLALTRTPSINIIFPHNDSHIEWVDEKLQDFNTIIYSYNATEQLPGGHYASGNCNEGDAYLQYIIDYYDSLPDISIFLHDHEESWHTVSPGIVQTLYTLKLDRIQELQLVSFACAPECYNTAREGHHHGEMFPPFRQLWPAAFSHALDEFGVQPPELLSNFQAASFAVTRNAIHRRSRDFYQHLKNWCSTTSGDPYWTGRLLEYTWQKMFLDSFIAPHHDCCDLSTATCTYHPTEWWRWIIK